jgi:hypothetical protein
MFDYYKIFSYIYIWFFEKYGGEKALIDANGINEHVV